MLPSKILVATDGSPAAKAAVDFAADTAKMTQAEVIEVLSVVQLGSQIYAGVEIHATPAHRAHVEQIAAEATARVKEIVGDAPVNVVTKVVEATSVGDAIIKHAAGGQPCGHIVIGDRGLGEFASVFLGSVAHHVVHRAHCPVTVVRI